MDTGTADAMGVVIVILAIAFVLVLVAIVVQRLFNRRCFYCRSLVRRSATVCAKCGRVIPG